MKITRLTIFLIFTLALILRIGFIVLYENGKMLYNEYHASDELSYDQIGSNLISGKGLVTDGGLYAKRGPAYPLFLALIYFIFGHSFVAARFAQAFVGALTCLVIYAMANEIFCKKMAVISALICVAYYPFIQYPAYLLSEVIFTFLITASLYFFVRYYNKRQDLLLLSASVLWGVASLCRTAALPFVLILLFWLCALHKFNLKSLIKPLIILMIGITVVILPWAARNYLIYRTFIPVAIESGKVLYYGNNPRATGGTGGWTKNEIDQFFPENIGDPNTPAADKVMAGLALKYMANYPKRTVILGFKKFINMWRPFYADARITNKVIMSLMYIPIIVCAIIGIILSLGERNKKYYLLYALVAYFIVVHMVTISAIRYRDPVMPVIIIFASFGLLYLKQRLLTKEP